MIVIDILFWIEAVLTLVTCICLTRLYIKNSAYSRDAMLVVAGLSTIVLSTTAIHLGHSSIMGQILLTQVCMSLFLLGNVTSKKIKWVSNFAKSSILCIFAGAIAANNVVYYQMSIMAIVLINFLFTFINFTKPLTRVYDITENILAIIVMSNCYSNLTTQSQTSKLILLGSILVFNGFITFHILNRVNNLAKLFKSLK